MKRVLIVSLLVLGAGGTAEAQRNCEQDVDHQIYRLENTSQDAHSNLRVLDQAVYQHGLRYCVAGEAMIMLLQKMGSGSTAHVQSIFKQLAEMKQDIRGPITRLAEKAIEVINAENTDQDALSTVTVVHQVSQQNDLNTMNVFESAILLTHGLGSGSTAHIHSMLKSLGQEAGRDQPILLLSELALELSQIENTVQDASSSINVAKSVARSTGQDLVDLLESIIELTKGLGSGSTAHAQGVLKSLAEIASHERVLTSALVPGALEIVALENTAQDALSNINVIKQVVIQDGFPSHRAFSFLAADLRVMGSGNTAQVQANLKRAASRLDRPNPRPRPRPRPPRRPRRGGAE